MTPAELMDVHRYLIFCERCLREVPPEKIDGFWRAEEGSKGEECGVLCCVPWTFRAPYSHSERFVCDSCGTGVAVARSSFWFVEKHREERGGVKPV